MKPEYRAWCAVHVGTTAEDCYGRCAWATLAMQIAFPELIRVRGHYLCLIWGERDHWWLTTPEGEIVDPTAAQFPSKGARRIPALARGRCRAHRNVSQLWRILL